MSASSDDSGIGRRGGRHTTHQEPAYDDDDPSVKEPMEPDATGVGSGLDDIAGYYEPTAMFNQGEFIGELGDILDGAPDTRAQVAAEDGGPRGFKLIVVSGPEVGTEWGFKKGEIHIGRGAENDIDFSDIGVSRNHVRIALDGNAYYLKDLGSNNGTLLNGRRVDTEPLSSGDEIVVGARTLRFVELNESPPTAAAHPIEALMTEEPAQGAASELVPAHDQEPGGSKVDVSAASVPAEPAVSAQRGEAPSIPPPSAKKARPGTAFKVLAIVLVVVSGLSAAGYYGYRAYLGSIGELPEQRLERAKTRFLQGIELVKLERFGDALILFESVLELRPEYARAQDYKDHCLFEIGQWEILKSAREFAKGERFQEAVYRLDQIDKRSAYRKTAARLKKEWLVQVAKRKVAYAREALIAGDLDGAVQLALEALKDAPGLPEAQAILDEVEALRTPKKKAPKPKPTIPPLMERAVGLYLKDKIPQAIDAAEAAGGQESRQYVQRMTRVKELMAEMGEAHKRKAAQAILGLAPTALELDRQVGNGSGRVRTRIKSYYADALYLKGQEAVTEENFAKAFKLLSEALRVKPGHQLSATRLVEIGRKAQELYYKGFVLKDKDRAQANKLFRRVIEMTATDSKLHRDAARRLKESGGN